MKIVLIMGLPGSGKTTLAKELVPMLNAKWLNADKIRTESVSYTHLTLPTNREV